MGIYKVLNKQEYCKGKFSIVPIRMEDRYLIMKWRNEQIYHLRQSKPLTEDEQDEYFNTVVAGLFEQDLPSQILFSYLEGDKCIGYGGLVHINWVDKNAEISYVMDTQLQQEYFVQHWKNYLDLLEEVAFRDLPIHKIFTYAFDLRPMLYSALEQNGFKLEARLKDHCYFNNGFIDVLIHSKFKQCDKLTFRKPTEADCELLFKWVNDKDVRRNSIHTEPIERKNHCKWFTSRLNSESTLIYIFQQDETSVGQVRIEQIEKAWLIDFSVDSKWRGKGIGAEMLKQVIMLNNNKNFIAYVKPENIGSFKVFSKLGFLNMGTENKIGTELIKFVLFEK